MRQDVCVIGEVPSMYLEAESILNRVQSKINRIGMNFPDISSFDFKLERYVFKKLPFSVSKGVRVMGIHLEEDYRSLVASFNLNSYILPHTHSSEIEVIQVLEGEIKDEVLCLVYEKGDIVKINKNQLHHITTGNKRSILYITFSENEKTINNLFKEL